MASTLAPQLHALAVAGGRPHYVKPSSRPSLLFHPSKAPDVDVQTILSVSRSGSFSARRGSSSISSAAGCQCQAPSLSLPLESRYGEGLGAVAATVPFQLQLQSRGISHRRGRCQRRRLHRVSAIDAAQEFDYESMKLSEMKRKEKLKVGIVGFGNFGQFLAERFVKQGHQVLATSRSDYEDVARRLKITYFRDADDFCEEHPEVVILCTSILSTETVLQSLPIQRLKRSTLFVDVLSVKEFPRNLLLKVLPTEFDILCTHPMFGPESGRGSWRDLPLVFDKVRVRPGPRTERCSKFLNVFESEGCRMVEMSCEEHDRHAAGSQFITHTVGRVLGSLKLESTTISTKGYESLLKLVENTYSDSFDLYYGLFLYNVNAIEELGRLERAFDVVKSELFNKLHGVLRQQMLTSSTSSQPAPPTSTSPTVSAFLKSQTSEQEKHDISSSTVPAERSRSSNNGVPPS